MSIKNKLNLRLSYFSIIILYCFIFGLLYLPSVHYYFDAVGIRDMGASWNSLTWKLVMEEGRMGYFVPVAVLRHIEGPLQFLITNLYSYLVGNVIPLNPAAFAFLNILFVLFSAVIAFLIGKHLHDERFGCLFSLCFVLSSWLGAAVRLPWIVFTMSSFLELLVLYAYLMRMDSPGKRKFKILAPLSLSLYLLTALDWPSFLSLLVLFLFLSKRLAFAFKNRYNLLPFIFFSGLVSWTVFMCVYGHPEWKQTLIAYPFFKTGVSWAPIAVILKYIFLRIGPAFILAIAGAYTVVRQKSHFKSIGGAFSLTMVVWFIVMGIVLIKSPISIHYVYVIAVPMAYLTAELLSRAHKNALLFAVFTMIMWQWAVVVKTNFTGGYDDRRVLAAAAFLIEKRPDLLSEDKVSFLPRDLASNVGQYARGRQKRIVMPVYFPETMKSGSFGSPVETLSDFVQAYRKEGKINADWIILNSELVSPDTNKYYSFYKQLHEDSNVDWIAEFKDKKGKKIWLGEVRPSSVFGKVEVYEVDPLADIYEKKYDRIDYLKQNTKYIDHY